jgi:hypothetical protein
LVLPNELTFLLQLIASWQLILIGVDVVLQICPSKHFIAVRVLSLIAILFTESSVVLVPLLFLLDYPNLLISPLLVSFTYFPPHVIF